MELNTYLSFDGTCAEAFDFYAEVLDGSVTFRMTWGESPMAADMPADQHGRVMHACVSFGEDRVLLGADAPAQYVTRPAGFCVAITFPDTDEAKTAFDALAEGGQINMPFGPTFWAKGFGMLIDRFGVPWMVNGAPEPMPS